ncbi:MAG: TerB family tellurite resistance protein [Bacteroidetes bacterium]|nr:TerB family tellurite resistance protein [Bacteroidota bacterium]
MGKLIAVIILAIVLYAVLTMRKKPGGSSGGTADKDSGGKAEKPSKGAGPFQSTSSGGYGKWVGGGLGWVFGGPIGGILGFALGSMFEGMNKGTYSYRGTSRGDFAMSLLVLSAAVMKADNKIVKSELDYVRSFFIRQFGEEEGSRLMLMLREILKQDIKLQEVSSQVGQFMDYSSRLTLLHFLFGIAAADGEYHPDEVSVIGNISAYMGISIEDFTSVKAMFVKDTNWAYTILEITPSATDDEVKKAYREMAKKHHPDMVAQLGDDIKRAATEKFQKISAAYEEIRKQRGMI